jgi:hypothetical protein
MPVLEPGLSYPVTATAPYTATLALCDGTSLAIALPGVSERALLGRSEEDRPGDFEIVPPSEHNPEEIAASLAMQLVETLLRRDDVKMVIDVRLERALGVSAGLGADTAAVAAIAAAYNRLVGGHRSKLQIETTLLDPVVLTTSPVSRAALLSSSRGGVTITDHEGQVRALATGAPLALAVVLFGLDRPISVQPAHRSAVAIDVSAALLERDLQALQGVVRDVQCDHVALTLGLSTMQQAGPGCVAINRERTALVGLYRDLDTAKLAKDNAIEAIAQAGLWPRGRAGLLDERGAVAVDSIEFADLQP